MIRYCGDNEYYNFISNNCANVAATSWNMAFDKIEFTSTLSPRSLKGEIGKKSGSFIFDMSKIVWK